MKIGKRAAREATPSDSCRHSATGNTSPPELVYAEHLRHDPYLLPGDETNHTSSRASPLGPLLAAHCFLCDKIEL